MNIPNKIKNIIPILILIGIMVVVFFPYFLGYADLHTGLIYTDLWLFNYPLKEFYRQMLLQGKLPFWTSLIGNGYPVFAEGQVGALYPLNLLFYKLFPTLIAYNINLFTHFSMAEIFTYVFARNTLKLSKKASLLSSFCYPFSGYFVLHTHQINIDIVITYLPIAFFLAERMTRSIIKYFPLLSLVFALQILAGHMEMFYYSTVLTFGFMLLTILFTPQVKGDHSGSPLHQKLGMREGKTGMTEGGAYRLLFPILGFVAALILAVGVTFVQLYPMYELNGLSQRSTGLEVDEAMQSRWPIKSLSNLIFPNIQQIYQPNIGYTGQGVEEASLTEVYIYIGALAFLLAIFSILTNRNRFSVIFSILLIFTLIYAFGNYTQLFTILWQTIPGLKFFRYPSKIAFFVTFSLSVLAGMGLDTLKTNSKLQITNYKWLGYAIMGISLADLLYFNVFGTRKLVKGSEWLKPPPAAEYLKDKLRLPYEARLYSHGTNNMDYNRARDPEIQKTIQNLLPRDFNMLYGIPNNREWVVFFIETQTGMNQEKTILDFENKRLLIGEAYKKSLAMQSVKYLISDVPIYDKDYKEIMFFPFFGDVDHEFYVAGADGGTNLVKIPSQGAHLYESDLYYPRAFFVTDFEVMQDDKTHKLQKYILSDSFDPKVKVVLEKEPINIDSRLRGNDRSGSGNDTGVNISKAEIIRDEQNSIEIQVEAENNGYLLLTDTYYPGWKAYVDGKETEILKANYAFRAVFINLGKHQVVMKYEPVNWKMAVKISVGSLILLVILTGRSLILSRLQKK